MGGDGELSPEGNEALQYLVRKGEEKVPARLIKNVLRRRKSMGKTETVDNAIKELKSAGYVQIYTPDRSETPCRPTGEIVLLHPGLLRERRPVPGGAQA